MNIKISYQVLGSMDIIELRLSPDEYFDPLENEDKYKVNSTSKYIFPYDYINIEIERLIYVKLEIIDNESFDYREIFFWNHGKNSTDYWKRFDIETATKFEWFWIISVFTDKLENIIEERIRMYKNEFDVWCVNLHSYENFENGSDYLNKKIEIPTTNASVCWTQPPSLP